MPASTVSHDYHLTMFPHKLFLLERNRWSMLLADTRLLDQAGALTAARAQRADDVGLLPAPRALVPAGEARQLPLDLGKPRANPRSAGASSSRSAAAPTGPSCAACTGAIRSISS